MGLQSAFSNPISQTQSAFKAYLLDVPIANLLIQYHTTRTLCDIVHHSRLAVVDFVRHTLLLSAVVLDVYDVADFVVFHEGGEPDHALLAVLARESVAVVSTLWLRWVWGYAYA